MDKNVQEFIATAIRTAENLRGSEYADVLPGEPNIVEAADAFYLSFTSPVNPPLPVRRAIVLKFLDNLERAEQILKALGYDGIMGCYYFTYAGMFHGVEPNGYIHT